MNDETTNNAAQALAARANQVEQTGINLYGEDLWKSAMRVIETKVANGEITPNDLQRKLTKPDAHEAILYEAAGDLPENDYRHYRDKMPLRAERIRKAGR